MAMHLRDPAINGKTPVQQAYLAISDIHHSVLVTVMVPLLCRDRAPPAVLKCCTSIPQPLAFSMYMQCYENRRVLTGVLPCTFSHVPQAAQCQQNCCVTDDVDGAR